MKPFFYIGFGGLKKGINDCYLQKNQISKPNIFLLFSKNLTDPETGKEVNMYREMQLDHLYLF